MLLPIRNRYMIAENTPCGSAIFALFLTKPVRDYQEGKMKFRQVKTILTLLLFICLAACTPAETTVTATSVGQIVPVVVANPTTTSATRATNTAVPATNAIAGVLAQVTHIVDGDTIDVEIEGITYRVRYIGMDTPERGEPFYSEATEINRQLVQGQTVILVKDVSETDRYGRLLRYVYLQDDTFVNATLVEQGYAQAATYPPDVAFADLFVSLQQEARTAGRGLWGSPAAPAISPPQPTNSSQPPPASTPLPQPANCDPAYPTVCIPSPPPDLNCGDIPHRRFQVLPPDPHGFDRDNDGIGCER